MASEHAYRDPPAVSSATAVGGGRILLVGRADAGARVRLAAPAGQALFTRSGPTGEWRMVLEGAPQLRLFGLSMVEGGRAVQAEGYLAVTPQGAAAQLRAGSGAMVLARGAAPRILAVDFDRKGGTVVSGTGAPGQIMSVGVDGIAKGRIAADRAGRFAFALNEPLASGDHRLRLERAGVFAEALVAVSPAGPLVPGPFQATLAGSGWRIDWMTPGGGVQTTVLITPTPSARP